MNEETIFAQAAAMSADERAAFLEKACQDNASLRARIEALLKAHDNPDEFLNAPAARVAATEDSPRITEGPGDQIGNYKLLQQIGEGGMGAVYMAEQRQPVRRRVALKIIKPGMDSRHVIARFEAERQALAMMDHPNIAKVLDAGTTESGRPYFAMELVKGQPIVEFCDRKRLTPRERLELFVSVCGAIQHAHQKGIVHRDIKPTNVLVASYDGRPVVKVIDFGVAKAIGQRLTERTLVTGFGAIVGSLEYMSPEQAEFNALDIDTRSDIYSLGVLLYELLTGSTPVSKARMQSSALNELLRVIREEEPPRPSDRISKSKNTLETISAARQLEPVRLTKLIRGDLDWVVMKALAKHRDRRYENASSLAADVERFLTGEPIEARPPSTWYRMRKAASKHRGVLVAGALVLVSLLAGIIASSVLAYRAINAERKTRDTVKELCAALESIALNAAFRGNRQEAELAIRKVPKAEAPPDLLPTLQGVALLVDGQPDEAIKLLKDAKRENPKSIKTDAALFWAYWQMLHYAKMDEIRNELRDRSWSGDDYDDLFMAMVRRAAGKPEQLWEMYDKLTDLIDRHPHWGIAYSLRSSALMELGMESKNIREFRQAVEDWKQAQRLVPDSCFIQSEGLYVLITAIEFAQDEQRECKDWIEHARTLAERLEDRPDFDYGLQMVARYYYLIREADRALELEEELVRRDVNVNYLRSALMFENRNLETVERDLRSNLEDPNARILLALLLTEKSEDGRHEAEDIFDDLRQSDLPMSLHVLAASIPLLLGEPNRAKDAMLDIEPIRRRTFWRWWGYLVDFHADKITEEELLEMTGPFGNSGALAYFAIGMRALSCGDRNKAIESFVKVEKSHSVGTGPYHWGKAFAARLKEDPDWLSWIEGTKTEH